MLIEVAFSTWRHGEQVDAPLLIRYHAGYAPWDGDPIDIERPRVGRGKHVQRGLLAQDMASVSSSRPKAESVRYLRLRAALKTRTWDIKLGDEDVLRKVGEGGFPNDREFFVSQPPFICRLGISLPIHK